MSFHFGFRASTELRSGVGALALAWRMKTFDAFGYAFSAGGATDDVLEATLFLVKV